MDHDSSSDDEHRLPPNVLTTQRRGWAGESLEIEHQRQSLLGEEKNSQSATAVDLSQFRNEEVGRGYQAKHVVRQRETAVSSSVGMVDMSGGAFERSEKKYKSEKKKETKRKRDRDSDKGIKKKKDSKLDSYLQSRGLETFLGEIESLLSR